ASALSGGPLRPRDLKTAASTAGAILRANYYGWFERIDKGVYGLTEAGRQALQRWPQAVPGEIEF
ncbi:DUF2161 family putative PD-(D/E)XK-type phosphodiesterase, partial [Neorhizobium sp. BETTINA12A]|uniref:DUF2161 family putative PD-(D/E)XK-type phosphodiesterase n=1 Tax=Neorhizobium sp. BETTINA12A TaxID=2908924 RepID=UPI001FF414C4